MKPINIYNNIFITGKPGIGKTHYIKEQIRKTVGDFTIEDSKVMATAPDAKPWEQKAYTGIRFVTTYEIQKRAFDYEFLDGLMKCTLLIIDDFGVSEYARRVCDVVLYLLSNRPDNTIVTSNLSLKEIGKLLDERVASRLSALVQIDSSVIGNNDRRDTGLTVKDIYIKNHEI